MADETWADGAAEALLFQLSEVRGHYAPTREVIRKALLAAASRERPADDGRVFDKLAADKLADEVAALVVLGDLGTRSRAGDALLDYRNPPRTERSDAIAAEIRRAREVYAPAPASSGAAAEERRLYERQHPAASAQWLKRRAEEAGMDVTAGTLAADAKNTPAPSANRRETPQGAVERSKAADAIADGVIAELDGRKGLRVTDLGPELHGEIRDAFRQIVLAALSPSSSEAAKGGSGDATDLSARITNYFTTPPRNRWPAVYHSRVEHLLLEARIYVDAAASSETGEKRGHPTANDRANGIE